MRPLGEGLVLLNGSSPENGPPRRYDDDPVPVMVDSRHRAIVVGPRRRAVVVIPAPWSERYNRNQRYPFFSAPLTGKEATAWTWL